MKQFLISAIALACLIFSLTSLYLVWTDEVWQAFKFFIVSLNLLFIAAILNGINNGKNSNKESTVSEQGMRIE